MSEEHLVAEIQSKHLLAHAVSVSSALLLSSHILLRSLSCSYSCYSSLFSVFIFASSSPSSCFMHPLRPNFPNPISQMVRLPGLIPMHAEQCWDYVNLLYMAVVIPACTALKPRQTVYCTCACNSAWDLCRERSCYGSVRLDGRCVRTFLHFAVADVKNSFL